MVAAGVLMAVLNSLVQNLALGPLSFALLDSAGLFAAALAAVWFAALFAYGMVWGSLGSVGDAAAGMRSVRISDGTTSGAWLAAGVLSAGPLHPSICSCRLPQRSAAEAGTVSPQISSPLIAVPGWPEAPRPCRIPKLRRCSRPQNWSTTGCPGSMATGTRVGEKGRTWLVRHRTDLVVHDVVVEFPPAAGVRPRPVVRLCPESYGQGLLLAGHRARLPPGPSKPRPGPRRTLCCRPSNAAGRLPWACTDGMRWCSGERTPRSARGRLPETSSPLLHLRHQGIPGGPGRGH